MSDDRWLYALGLTSVASGIAGLLVPLYLVRIGAGAGALGVSAALSSLVGAPGAIYVGRYADRTGRRRNPVLIAIGVATLAVLVLPAIESIPGVILVSAVLWLALSAIAPVLTMLVVGSASRERWDERIARLNTVQGYGTTGGLVIGTAWVAVTASLTGPERAQDSLFLLAAGIGIVGVAFAARFLPAESRLDVGKRRSDAVVEELSRTNRTVRNMTTFFGWTRVFWALRSASVTSLRRLRGEIPIALWAYFGAALLFFVGFGAFWAPLPLYLTTSGFGSEVVFGLYLINNVASTLLFGRAGRMTASRDVRIVQSGALGIRATAFVGTGALGVVWVELLGGGAPSGLLIVAGLLAVVGLSWAFIAVAGTAIVSRLAPDRSRGSLLGTYGALAAVGGSVGSIAGGAIAARSFPVAFGVAGALVVAAGVGVLAIRRLSELGHDSIDASPLRLQS